MRIPGSSWQQILFLYCLLFLKGNWLMFSDQPGSTRMLNLLMIPRLCALCHKSIKKYIVQKYQINHSFILLLLQNIFFFVFYYSNMKVTYDMLY